jgi:hypothetical protein
MRLAVLLPLGLALLVSLPAHAALCGVALDEWGDFVRAPKKLTADGPAASRIAQQNPDSSQAKPKKPRVKPNAGVGTLRLLSRGWADVYVDGRPKGRLPQANSLELSAGKHKLKLVKPGYKTYEAVIVITAEETTEHEVTWVKDEAPSEVP